MTSYLRSVVINASSPYDYDLRTSFLPDYRIGRTFCSASNVAKMVTNDVNVVDAERQGCFFFVHTLFLTIWFLVAVIWWTLFFLGRRRRRRQFGPLADKTATIISSKLLTNKNDGEDCNEFKTCDILAPTSTLFDKDDNKDVFSDDEAELSHKNKRTPIGWPLCTSNRLIVHFGNLVDDDPDIFNGVEQLETGDFYVSVDVFNGQRTSSAANGNNDDDDDDEKIIISHRSTPTTNRRVALILHYYDKCDFVEFKEITLSPLDFVNLFAYLTLEREYFDNILNSSLHGPTLSSSSLSSLWTRLKFRRYLSLTSNGQLDIMPLIDDDNNEKQRNNLFVDVVADHSRRRATFFANCVQNDEYFSFSKTGNDSSSNKSDRKISKVNDTDVIGQTKISEMPNLVDFTLTTVSTSMTSDSVTPTSSSSSNDNVGLNSFDNLTKRTSSSFIGRCPRKLSDMRDQLISNGCIRYTGTITWEECQTCAVEVLLTKIYLTNSDGVVDYFSSSDLAKAFVYIHYVHKSSTTSASVLIDDSTPSLTTTKKFPFIFIVDCRIGQKDTEIDRKAVRLLADAVNLLKIVRSNVTCELILIDADESVKRMLQEYTTTTNDIEFFNFDELYAKLAPSQLTEEMGGERKYDGVRWVQFRKDLESFMDSCRMAAKFYINAIQRLKKLNEDNSPTILWSMSSNELKTHSEKLRNDLNYTNQADATLETLFVGGAIELTKLDEFVKQHESVPHYKEAVTKVTAFFDEVHRVMLKYQQSSDRFTSMIEEIMKTKQVLDDINSIISWFETDAKLVLERFRTKPNGTKSCKMLKQEFDTLVDGTIQMKFQRTSELKSALQSILHDCRHLTIDQRREIDSIERRLTNLFDEYATMIDAIYANITSTILCYQLLDEAYEWALDSMKLAANVGKTLSSQKTSPTIEQLTQLREKLIEYLERNPQYDDEKLEKMRSTAQKLNEDRLKIQCQAVDVRCSDTEKMLLTQKIRLDEILSSNNLLYDDVDEETNNKQENRCRIGSGDYEQPSSRFSLTDAAASSSSTNNFSHNRRRSFAGSCSTSLHDVGRRFEITNNCLSFQKSSVDLYIDEKSEDTIDSGDVITDDFTDQVVSSITTTMLRKKINERRAANNSIIEKKKIAPVSSDPSGSSATHLNIPASVDSKFRRPFRRFIRRGSLMDVVPSFADNHSKSRHPSLDSLSSVGEDSHHSSSLSAKSLPTTPLDLLSSTSSSIDSAPPYPAPLLPPEADDKLRVNTPPPDCSPNVRMQYNVVNELLQTEIAYVRSLQYVIENYIPEMQRTDLPHALRGQRRVIFGNIEKIHEFHVGHFLPDLTRYCLKSTETLGLHVAKCFLRHRLKFQLYALYNKNKPNSDALISECAGVFFRTKQLLLGDKLDLWSYLLKPVQRISKYSLFVQKLIKSCPSDDAEQIESLKSVEEMLMSQLQHGNDLLAMDSIRNCDLNLKEQGRLLRQEEFVVYEGRNGRKCQRRIFLFENLILFAKPVKVRGSGGGATTSEIYRYKHSIKMSDLGMTETVGDCELKFELWFRRHTSDEIYTILSPNMTTKMAWITRVSKLLWQQAHLNRELRISEMTSMGSGSKVCVDLTSEDRIQDRAVSSGLFSKACRSRAALPSALDVDRFNLTTKRPHSLISVGSSSSSNNSSLSGTGSGQLSLSATTTPMSLESGFVDLSTLEEYPDDPINDVDTITSSTSSHRNGVEKS